MLFLADIDPSNRFEAFEQLCFERVLAPTTAESYWTTWLGAQKTIGILPSDSDQRVAKILKARSTAYPVEFPTPASASDMELLFQTFKEPLPSMTAIAMLAFINGQRISDMIQLAVSDLTPMEDFLLVTVRRGKTMMVSKPYTLWMRRNQYPAEALIELAISARKLNRLFLFTEFNSDEERQRVLSVIRDMLTSVNDSLELRSFRRGGLQRMAQRAVPLNTILQFSRHSDVNMLMRYLNWGQHATQRQAEMIEVVDLTTTDMTFLKDNSKSLTIQC
jgi:integrase